MPESFVGVLGADLDTGTAALAALVAAGVVMVALAVMGGRILVAVLKRAAFLALLAVVGAGGFLLLRDGVATGALGDLVARTGEPTPRAGSGPDREAPRTAAGYREVVAYMDAGSFALTGRANGVPLDFVFDTGATAVVLTADDAARIGWPASRLDYTVSVSTANGTTRAALVTLERLAIGGIEERDVRALVAQPGDLRENLLGMTFLSRLEAYEVRADRLVLRGR